MDKEHAEAVALHRWAVIAEATGDRLEPAERGCVGARHGRHARTRHPDGQRASLQPGHPRSLDPSLASRWPRGTSPRDAL